jgi:hypothetical protein
LLVRLSTLSSTLLKFIFFKKTFYKVSLAEDPFCLEMMVVELGRGREVYYTHRCRLKLNTLNVYGGAAFIHGKDSRQLLSLSDSILSFAATIML